MKLLNSLGGFAILAMLPSTLLLSPAHSQQPPKPGKLYMDGGSSSQGTYTPPSRSSGSYKPSVYSSRNYQTKTPAPGGARPVYRNIDRGGTRPSSAGEGSAAAASGQ